MKHKHLTSSSFLYLFILLLGISCSGSKAYYKRAEKLRAAGMEKEAAEYYLISAQRNTNNIDAKIALKQFGQKVLDEHYQNFYIAYGSENHALAVKEYRQAIAYEKKVGNLVVLEKPPYYEDYYKESKGIYLADQYGKANELVEEGEFEKAKPMFQEIVEIDPSYQDAADLLLYSDLEPRYQKAVKEYNSGNYTGSYEIFNQITKKSSNYKESKMYMSRCLEKGRITIAIMPSNSGIANSKVSEVIQTGIVNQVLTLNDPFLVMIDRQNTKEIIKEQKLGMSGALDNNSVAEAGKLLGAKWVINAKLLSYNQSVREPVKSNQIGYLKYSVRKYDKAKDTYYNAVEYKKVNYAKAQGSRTVNCQYSVTLISSETGQIIYSNTFSIKEEDVLQYAESSEATSNLFPGNNTEVFTSSADKRALDQLLSEKRRSLASEDELVQKVSISVGKSLASELKKLK